MSFRGRGGKGFGYGGRRESRGGGNRGGGYDQGPPEQVTGNKFLTLSSELLKFLTIYE